MGDSEIVREFLVESYENLDRLDQELVSLESNPQDHDALASIFRTIHTIKGTCGFFGFSQLEAVTHVGESLLSRLRDNQLTLNPEITTALLQLVDAIRQMLTTIEQTGQEGERDDAPLIANLTRLQTGSSTKVVIEPPASQEKPAIAPAPLRDSFAKAPSLGELLVAQGSIGRDDLETALEKQNAGDQRHLGEILVENGVIRPHEVREALTVQQAMRGQSAAESTIRVNVTLLDQLMNLVGELVLVRNQILQFTRSMDESGLQAANQRLNLTTRDLQEGVMKTRMQPIGTVWSKFPRTVRDIANACGKQVRIAMEGEDTELDKTIIEAIKDPLMHLVRNAVDHGIEQPATRAAAGKNPEGTLSLRAFHEGAYVSIEIKDDGAGLNLDKVRARASQNGLIGAEQLARMGDREVTNLIFLPGFSTAEKVTNVSGRGVGMDVVKTNIEKVGGTVDVLTVLGEGTTVRMKIPLTLTIIPSLIVCSEGSRYAIPQRSLLELVRLEGERIRSQIETVKGAPVYRLREKLLPLVYLKQVLKRGPGAQDPAPSVSDSVEQDLDCVQAQNEHQAVLTALQRLNGPNHPDGRVLRTSYGCLLGAWIHQVGVHKFSSMAEMYELGRADKAFHALADSFLARANSGGDVGSTRKLEEMVRSLHRIIELLALVEKKVLETSSVNIIVLQARDRQFGLIVDEVTDTAEIVVKALGNHLKRLNVYSGATIMGDGKVVLILDAVGLAQRAHIFDGNRPAASENEASELHAQVGAVNHKNRVVLVECGVNQRYAIALPLIARLEEFSQEVVESTGDVQNVQYRGQIMRLIRIADLHHPQNSKPTVSSQERFKVVVFSGKTQCVGLVVDRILDVADEEFVVQEAGRRAGTLGSAVIQQRITEIVDVAAVISSANHSMLSEAAHA